MSTNPLEGLVGRLLKARTQLLLDEPFFGTLVMRLPLVEDRSCKTMWVDGTRIGYNPKFVAKCTNEELKGVFCHEVLHVTNGHCWRRGDRDPKDWNEACDYVINPIVVGAGMMLPEGALINPDFKGQPAEQVYDTIHRPKMDDQGEPQGAQDDQESEDSSSSQDAGNDNEDQEDDDSEDQSQDASQGTEDSDEDDADGNSGSGNSDDSDPSGDTSQDGNDAGGGNANGDSDDQDYDGPPVGEVRDAPKDVNPKELENEWKVAVEQAEKVAAMRGNLPGQLKRLIEELKKPTLNWRDILRQFVQQSWLAMDYTWRAPSTRYMSQGLYMPKLASETIPSIVIFIDTSASIWGKLLAAFQEEVQTIKAEINPDETYIGYADAAVAGVDRFEAGEMIVFNHRGGGGTDFRPAFNWVEEQGLNPACFVYLTDLEGAFPEEPPAYPVLWVSPPTALKPKWGDHVEMQQL